MSDGVLTAPLHIHIAQPACGHQRCLRRTAFCLAQVVDCSAGSLFSLLSALSLRPIFIAGCLVFVLLSGWDCVCCSSVLQPPRFQTSFAFVSLHRFTVLPRVYKVGTGSFNYGFLPHNRALSTKLRLVSGNPAQQVLCSTVQPRPTEDTRWRHPLSSLRKPR